MKTSSRSVIIVLGLLLTAPVASLTASTFTDPVGDGALVGAGGGILDISSVDVNNTATTLSFKINLAGDPVATDWGKYMIGIVTGPGGDPVGNGWVRPIGMNVAGLGMNYFVGSWVDWGNGAEVRNYTGSGWNLQSATYNPNPDNLSITKNNSSVTLQFNFAGLGLGLGSTFLFDVFTSGGGGTDGAIDSAANPLQTIANWSDPYNTGFRVQSYTLVPEPSVFALLGLGALFLVGRARHR
jgi:hypothetical protein